MSEDTDNILKNMVKQELHYEKLKAIEEDFKEHREDVVKRLTAMEAEFNTFRRVAETFNSIKKTLYVLISTGAVALITAITNRLTGTH